MFELHQLEQFLAVVDTGTVSKAAEKMNITQPALSRSLQNLEYELKTPLFKRTKNKVVLTETGAFAAGYARKLLSLTEEMQHEVQAFYQTHTNILIASCAPCELLFELRDIVKDCFPEISCETVVLESETEIMQKLLDGTCAMALFAEAKQSKLVLDVPLESEQLFAMIPDGHPLASNTGITFSEINGEAVIPFPLKGHWTTLLEQKLPDSQLLYQANIEAFDKIINSSNLISFESDMLRTDLPSHKSIPILDSEASITYHFAVLKTNQEQYRCVIQKMKERGLHSL
ncbi:MAG: LysR family transcriptional regulator [Treponema sp.]|nr:LysR family transcriptional regulator [Treponema sp.]